MLVRRIPNPQIDEPFLSINNGFRSVLRKIVIVSVRQLIVEQNGLAHFGFHLQLVERLAVDPPRKRGFPTQ